MPVRGGNPLRHVGKFRAVMKKNNGDVFYSLVSRMLVWIAVWVAVCKVALKVALQL